MDAEAQNPLADPFLSHLVLVLSIYELGPFPAPVPRYDGPSSWQTDNILRALKIMARRMYTAEETLASIKASENWENGPDTKKRRSMGDTPPISNPSASDVSPNSPILPISSNGSTASGYSTSTIRSTSATPIPHSSSSPSFFPPYNLAALAADFEQDVNMSETGSDQEPSSHSAHFPDRTASPMTISLEGLQSAVDRPNYPLRATNGPSLSAPPTSHSDLLLCPVCNKAVNDSATVGKILSAVKVSSLSGSPLVVPPGGPLATAAFESGMSAVEELRLLKAQVQDVARVCNAVARGDLSQKITVPVQGVVMVQLKDVINGMVDKLGQFAREVTRVSQEVGTEGCVSFTLCLVTPPDSILFPSKLGGQALVLDVEGTWRELTGVVNKLAANLTNQVRNILRVTKAVALGDLSKQIDVDARGEILDLKNTVNGMVVRLRALAAEVTRVTLEVGSQGKLGGQAHVPDVEGVWLELTRNVRHFFSL
jgi:osomolarity two-component system, sensor histidine kinase NIK1